MIDNRFFNSKFNQSINNVKGLAISLVVLGHIASPLTNSIYSFHIPLFFCLSGLFINLSNPFWLYVRKSFYRLIAPFLIYGFIGLLAEIIKDMMLNRPMESILDSLIGLFWWMDSEHMNHYGMVLWFLPALFWGRLLVYVAANAIKNKNLLLLGIVWALALLVLRLPNLPFGIDNAFFATPWIAFGVVLHRKKQTIFLSDCRVAAFILIASILIFFWFSGMQRIDVATKTIGNFLPTIVYTYTIIFAIIYLVYYFVLNPIINRKVNSALYQLGEYSLVVLVFHPYTNNIAHLIVNYCFNEGFWWLKFSLSLTMIFFIVFLVKKYSRAIPFRCLTK